MGARRMQIEIYPFYMFVLFTPDKITINTKHVLMQCFDNSNDVSWIHDRINIVTTCSEFLNYLYYLSLDLKCSTVNKNERM